MNSGKHRLLWCVWMVFGTALLATGIQSLHSSKKLATDRNPFALQRSAYGKLLARLSESTVDRVWHVGVEQIAPHVHGEECDHGEDCDHDHGSHGHDHSKHPEHEHTHPAIGDEPELTHTHPHDHDDAHYHGEEIVFAEHDHHHDQATPHDHESHAGHNHAEGEECKWCEVAAAASGTLDTSSMNWIERSKTWLTGLSGTRYLRTNPKSMSAAHVASVKRDVENMLLRSYKMDPTHYGVYNSYHLFLTTHEFGGNEASRKQAELIARHTISAILQEDEDPEPWLTAAAATMNLYLLQTESFQTKGEPIPVELLREYQRRIGFCLARFAELQEKSEESGTWANLSTDRQLEIAERARFATRTYEPFEAMIARAEARTKSDSDGEIVEVSPVEEND